MFYHKETGARIPEGTAFSLNNTQYPSNWLNLTTSEEKLNAGIYDLITDQQPPFNPISQMCVQGDVVERDGIHYLTWTIIDLPAEVIQSNTQKATEDFMAKVVTQTQLRLDTFAQTRSYDNILSACTYASSAIPRFQSDGQYCVNSRDTTWEALYAFMLEVQSGTRPMPSTVDEVLGILPELVWPS